MVNSSSVIFWILCAVVTAGSCGPARPMPLPDKTLSPINRSEKSLGNTLKSNDFSLNVKVVSLNSATGPSANLTQRELPRLNESVTVNEKQIVYGCPFPKRGCGLYFVWPRDSLGSVILHGVITYRVWNATNHWTSDLVTVPIRFDSSGNQWFVSVFDLVRQRTSGIPPDPSSETQVFILEMGLANQMNKTIEIRFRIRE